MEKKNGKNKEKKEENRKKRKKGKEKKKSELPNLKRPQFSEHNHFLCGIPRNNFLHDQHIGVHHSGNTSHMFHASSP